MGSKRNDVACSRLLELAASQPATFDSKVAEAAAIWHVKIGTPFGYFGSLISDCAERSVWPNPSWDHLNETLEGVLKHNKTLEEGAALTDEPVCRAYYTCWRAVNLDFLSVVSHSDKWRMDGGEAALVGVVNAYEYRTWNPVFKTIGVKVDPVLTGAFLPVLGARYGSLDAVRTCCAKMSAAFVEMGLAKSHMYGSQHLEIFFMALSPLYALLLLGERAAAASLLATIGFEWDDVGFEAWWARDAFPKAMFPKATLHTMVRLLIFLSSPDDGALDPAEVLAWLPPPVALGKLDKSWFTTAWSGSNVTALGARAYERLRRDDEAAETARLGVAQQKKKLVIADCHCVLGRVAARRGEVESAEAHFRSAVDEARTARAHAFEIVAAREWRRNVLGDAAGRAADADAVIDAACARMGKGRGAFASLL